MAAKLETLETLGLREGNTSLPLKPEKSRAVPGLYWCFTWHDYTLESLETKIEVCKTLGIEFVFGKETCPQTGRKHIQGFLKFKVKSRPIEKLKWEPEIHWEKCKGSQEQNIEYCSKEGNFESNIKMRRPLKKAFSDVEMYPWQKELDNTLRGPPDDRSIIWIWEDKGSFGKTEMAKHIVDNYGALVLTGKSADAKFGIASYLKDKKNPDLDVIVFHFVRSQEDFISYESLESCKDGIFFSGKYESAMVRYNIPHVVVFANFAPLEEKLSADRWIIKKLTERDKINDKNRIIIGL